MAKIVKCDMCGKVLKGNYRELWIRRKFLDLSEATPVRQLCSGCTKVVLNYIDQEGGKR